MSKLTDWFPPEVKPVHVGFYESIAFRHYDELFILYWDGTEWLLKDLTESCLVQDREWRGLAEKPVEPVTTILDND